MYKVGILLEDNKLYICSYIFSNGTECNFRHSPMSNSDEAISNSLLELTSVLPALFILFLEYFIKNSSSNIYKIPYYILQHHLFLLYIYNILN